MEISYKLKNFINENIDLINENSRESWEELYERERSHYIIRGEFTQAILEAGINDPVTIMGYIPKEYLLGSSIQKYIIPDNVINIGDQALCSCSRLRSIVIPDSVTSIGSCAFMHCLSLTRIIIPDNVTSIGISAFEGCKNLEYVALGKEIKYIDMMAFAKCHKLESIDINLDKKEVTERFMNGNRSWLMYSSIKNINCLDGVIEL